MSKIVYNYGELDSVDAVCRKLVNETTETIQKLRREMQTLVGDGWAGDTSKSYDAKVNELGTTLSGYGDQLEAIDNQFVKGNQNMRDTDKRGGGKMDGV